MPMQMKSGPELAGNVGPSARAASKDESHVLSCVAEASFAALYAIPLRPCSGVAAEDFSACLQFFPTIFDEQVPGQLRHIEFLCAGLSIVAGGQSAALLAGIRAEIEQNGFTRL